MYTLRHKFGQTHLPSMPQMEKKVASSSARITPSLQRRVERVARRLDRSKSWVVCECLKIGLPTLEKSPRTGQHPPG
jgi:hypothetical protein